jgi:geranylgeranylglycerol-phosphate geranylgeranyltransferase
MKKISAVFRLLRFELPFSAGICVIMGQLLALADFASLTQTLLGFLSVFCVSAAILVLNDYFDVATDMINAPDRPIPSNMVSPNEALFLSLLLFVLGLLFSLLLSITTFWAAIVLSLIGTLYNWKLKKSGLAGNFLVSFSVGMTFVFGAISVGLPFNKIAWIFGIIAALIDLGEEIAADAMDMEGDKLIQSNSLAIRYGPAFAIKSAVFIFFIVVILTLVPFILQWLKWIYLAPILLMDGFIAYAAIRLLQSSGQQGRNYIRILYLGATAGLILFIVMRLFEIQYSVF